MYDLKVLVVDDEPNMRAGIMRALGNYRMRLPDIDEDIYFQIDSAETGEEAFTKIKASLPDILLLDYKLPDITGLELLEKLEMKEDSLLTIMITAYASLDTAVSAIKSGAYDFLAKPFTPGELKSTVSKAAQSLILAKQVKKLNEEKRQVRFQFISVLGHELKAPLSAIEGYMYMLKDRAAGNTLESYDKMVERCLVRTDQMRKLIADLLEMTKIESGQRARNLIQFNLREAAENAVELMTPDAEKRGIGIFLDCDAKMMACVDKEEIEIVFNNLVSNAVKYNRDGGKVNIQLVKEPGKILIKVSDTGIGMNDEEVAKLFREFMRIKNSKTKDIVGSGLGLSTVKKIAQLYGGDVTVESTPDVGTTFTVLIPANDEAAN